MGKAVKMIVWLLVAAAVVFGVAAAMRQQKPGSQMPKASPTPVAETGPIKIGFIGPLTGDAAAYGEPLRNMVALAVEEINSAGGVQGRSFKVIYEDGKCNGKDAANAMQKLANVDKVKVVIGGFCSSESLASVPIATQNGIALLSVGSSSPDLTGISPNFARNYPSDASQGQVLAEAAHKEKGWKHVVMAQEQLDYPLGIFKAFSSTFEKLGGKVEKEEFPSQTVDFRSVLAKLRARNADALFINTQTPAVAERILKQVQELKWKPALLINDATAGDPTTVSRNATQLEGALTAEFGVDPANQKFQHILAAYKAKYGADTPFQSYAQTDYDGVYMIKDAIAAVGYDGNKIASYLRGVKDWPGASGSITIGSNGDRVGGHRLETIKSGKVVRYTE